MFRLHLNGDNRWHITATEGQHDLVREMARLMRLKPADDSEGASQLIFTGPNGASAFISTGNGDAKFIYEDARLRSWWFDDRQDVICEVPAGITGDDVYKALRMVFQIIHHNNVLKGGLTLHAAFVEFNGRGILLAAKGGTGKSTCCRRLPKCWKAWCDDETLLASDSNLGYLAHPFPAWSHYLDNKGIMTWDTEFAILCSAIFFLQHADGDRVTILPASEPSMWLYHSVYPIYHRNFGGQAVAEEKLVLNTRLFDNACNVALRIPAYRLEISLNGQFWKLIEDVI